MTQSESTLQRLFRRVANIHMAAVETNSVLSSSARQKINAELIRAGMDGNKMFRRTGEALQKISEVLDDNGIEWDEILSGGQFNKPKGRASIDLASQGDDPFSPVSIQNTSLAFHWDTLDLGVEVVAYIG